MSMGNKQAKKFRKYLRQTMPGGIQTWKRALSEQPFSKRLNIAWQLLTKTGVFAFPSQSKHIVKDRQPDSSTVDIGKSHGNNPTGPVTEHSG